MAVTPSRRTFLAGAAAVSAYFWIPKAVKGYSAREMRTFAIDQIVKPALEADLDTPALCVIPTRWEEHRPMQATRRTAWRAGRTPRRKCPDAQYQIKTDRRRLLRR